jgi:hypothetical protein
MGRPAFVLAAGVLLLSSLIHGAGVPTDDELESAINDAPAKAPAPKPPVTKAAIPRLAPPSATALTPVAPSAFPLAELFSAEKNPGRGTLEYARGATTDKIVFGAETGHYLMGMVFAHDTLPRSIQAEFKNNEVIQLAFGTLAQSAGARVGQFGSATVLVSRQVATTRTIPLRIPTPADPLLPESAFMLFASPDMGAQLSDEEKLKGTFFAKGGNLILTAANAPKTIPVAVDGRKIPFKIQAMRMNVQAVLTTPFNSEEQSVKGQVEFPLYWPEGAAGKRVAREMAEASFNAKTALEVPEEFSASRRGVTAEPARPRPKSR